MPVSPAVVAMLKSHKAIAGRRATEGRGPLDRHGLVFTTEAGAPVEPRNILRTIETAADRIGVVDVGVHTLRHSAATAWLDAGVHIKAVADLLGHSSISVTGDIYGHASDAATRAAVDGLSGTLGLQVTV